MKENNCYTGFGSQIVFQPKDLRFPDNNKNVNDSVTRFHDLKFQLRHFTIRAHVEDTVNDMKFNIYKDVSSNNSTVEANTINNGRLLVIETNSCESFHSCHSFISNQDPVKSSHNHGKVKNMHKYSRKESSEENFLDQITLVNAIFLNKKTYQNGNDSFESNSITKRDVVNKTNQTTPDFSNNDDRFIFQTDHCSGDNTVGLIHDCRNCKISSYQKCMKNEETLNNRKEKFQHRSKIKMTKLIHKKHCTNNYGLKTFKINRKIICGINKPTKSKPIRKKGFYQSMQHKPSNEIKCSGGDIIRSVETPNCPEADSELHKCILLLWKQCIHESYEMHFLEPIQLTNYSIALCSRNVDENLNIDISSFERKEMHENQECKTVNSYDDFEKSFLKLNKLQNSNRSLPIIKDTKETEISTNFVDDSANNEVNQSSKRDIDLKLDLTKDQDSLLGKRHDLGDITVLYESEKKYSAVPLNETFLKTILDSEGCVEQTDIGLLKSETIKGYMAEDKSDVIESNTSVTKNITEQNLEIKNSTKTVNCNSTSCVKHRSSSSRKSALPVIEEGLEESSKTDVLDDNYCLVDTLGRPIHLFDRRGLPLTDGSGRPLRSSEGELLMKCDDDGIPVVDDDTQIFDMFRRQPHEEGFQPWMSPQVLGASRLTLGNGRPLVLFDLESRPLTSVSGTMLVDSSGRSLLKLRNCFVPSAVHN